MAGDYSLGRLERMDLRQIWESEAQHFTPWLAEEDNLAILAETIGMELELEAVERSVGPFRADILCKSTLDGSWVLIENQLEKTDHIHLGQLLTYAAGLQAVSIVWIAAVFTEEHRATLDWLNDITDESFRFFGLEIELWKIGNSPAAPKFNIISKPNDWTRSISQAAGRIEDAELTDIRLKQKEYWGGLKQLLDERNFGVHMSKPYPQNWMDLSIGRSGFWLSPCIKTRENKIVIGLIIYGGSIREYFRLLYENKTEIEAEVGIPLIWRELNKSCRIELIKDNVDPMDEKDWPHQHEWMAESLEKLNRVFRERVRKLNAADWIPAENGK